MSAEHKFSVIGIPLRRAGLTWLAVTVLSSQTHAQFTGNNQTSIISGVTSNWPGDYHVGSNN